MADTRDAEEIARLANALGRLNGGSGTAMTAGHVRDDLLAAATPFTVFVAAQRDDAPSRLLGYAMAHAGYETAFAARGHYLSDLYVDEDARRMGLATRLIAAVARHADAHGETFV
ncbi:MAG: GNAT family N-acetyltransferase, partial [Pseudomonadota bacterium]